MVEYSGVSVHLHEFVHDCVRANLLMLNELHGINIISGDNYFMTSSFYVIN